MLKVVGVDGTGRYPDSSGHICVNLGGTAEAISSRPCFIRDGSFFGAPSMGVVYRVRVPNCEGRSNS